VLGRYDIAAEMEAQDSKHLGKAIIRANHMAGVVFTETLPEVEYFGEL
jgi:uncharacterized protein with GYD domain